ncbi:MAG: SPFH domain-containing protein, partial [Candidatus Poseidoniaceae archaeon]|nr:SPFH domain-containing protein [Candidatus Poseidoniaceae archaeon]
MNMPTDDGTGIMTIAILAFIGLLALSVLLYASRFKRCPSDKILVIYGKTTAGQFAQCHHGGGKFVWPLFQDYAFIDLKPMTIQIDLQNALSLQNIRINVPSTFTIGVSTVKAIMQNAAERLLGQQATQIEEMAKEIIFGQLRLTVASLRIEQINQDRESFLELIRSHVEPELNKVGLYLINVNITDIHDEANYIESIGKKAAATAVEAARVDVAQAERDGAVGTAEADRQREVEVAEHRAESEKGKKGAEINQRVYVQSQEALGIEGENKAKANIADYNAGLAEKEAAALQRAEVARRQAETEIQKAQYSLEQERLKAEEIVR